MSNRIAALARRVESDEFFLAFVLADYAHTEGLDDKGLAERLGCSEDTLISLRLCRRPNPDPNIFLKEVRRIASRFGADATVIAEAVRRSDALRVMRSKANAEEGGMLIAARDRREEDREGGKS